MKTNKLFLLVFFVLFALYGTSFAWKTNEGDFKSLGTHEYLTHYAALLSVIKPCVNESDSNCDYLTNLNFNYGLQENLEWEKEKRVWHWLIYGAHSEDAGTVIDMLSNSSRFNNHFHNPLKNWEQAGISELIAAPPFYIEGKSSLLWAQDSDYQSEQTEAGEDKWPEGDWTWKKTREYFYSALTAASNEERQAFFAQMFKGLGHQAHLLQDKAVPAHVRNDAHPLPWHLEKWLADNPNIISCLVEDHQVLDPLILDTCTQKDENGEVVLDSSGNPVLKFSQVEIILPEVLSLNINDLTLDSSYTSYYETDRTLEKTALLTDTDQYNAADSPSTSYSIGLAEYTNGNFFSDDTIFTENMDPDDRHFFLNPDRTSTNLAELEGSNIIPTTFTAADGIPDGIKCIKKNSPGEEVDCLVRAGYLTDLTGGSEFATFDYRRTFILDAPSHESYVKHLIPRAIGYSAALIDYFFRGKLELQFPDGGISIVNRSEETMADGFFELFYDSPDGTRTLITKENISVDGVAPGSSQAINNSSIPCGVPLTAVFRGKLGDEHDAVIGRVVDNGVDCIVLKAGDSTGTHFFTVWNPLTNTVAEIPDPVTGTPVTFPAQYDEISNWLSQHAYTVTTPAYQWEMENNALKRIGENWMDVDNCSCTVDTNNETSCNDYQERASFVHPGCGEFISYCDYTQTLTSQDGKDIWNTAGEGTVFVDRDFQWSILGSYAPIVNTTAGNGEAACVRSQWQQYQSARTYVPDGSLAPFEEWNISQPITWVTPIGEMDLPSESYEAERDYYTIYNCPSTATWSRWHRNPPYSGEPVAKPIIHSLYSDDVMVQLYFVSSVHWSGTETVERINVNDDWECQTVSSEESFSTENQLTASCNIYGDSAANHDPRTQERNPEFENAVLSLVEHTITAQQANVEISKKEVFRGGISIYIAGKNNNGTESGLLTFINEERALLGLYPLLPDNSLNSAAQRHVIDMATVKVVSHTGSDGSTIQDRFNAAGYGNIVKPGGSSSGTEYITAGINTAFDLFTMFRISSSWDTMMYADFKEMGVSSSIDDEGKRYWCLTFGYNDEH